MPRPILATIDTHALQHNLALARQYAGRAAIVAVIKANGYGHGLLRAAKALAGAEAFGVLGIDDAILLREAGYRQRIVLLEGLFDRSELPLALRYGLTPVVHSEPQLSMLSTLADDDALDVFLKINTGMNRLGIPCDRFGQFYGALRDNRGIREIVLATHFATADGPEGVSAQLALFNLTVDAVAAPRSLANSAALLRYPEAHGDWVRPGIMLYGATPFADVAATTLGLRASMTLSSEIIATQHLDAGDAVGYGRRFVAERPRRIGVVACGYADGYPRHAPNGTPIAVGGVMTSTVGRVSMDMLYCDLTDLPQAGIGSPVELWGQQVPVDAVAEACGTVGYELLCALAPRVPVREA